ncbi:DNA polymerase epsilon subunit 4 [Anopheles darlingi]|uniref:DNA polymerase epsilon subunit 4 n=1 Tax=Anopheles darlingi TaxID=43151 RepID=UPI0020FFFD5A|nr:DNA polymerase epsilon subunit 4 [Anopheles darlingi]
MAEVQYSEDLFISQNDPDCERIVNVENNFKYTGLPSENELPALKIMNNEINNCENADISLFRESNGIQSSCGNGHQEGQETDVAREERLSHLPFARIKQLMKVDCEISIISAEAIFVVTKATELFIQTLAKDACSYTMDSKKKNISKADIEKTIGSTLSLKFLEGMMNL